MGGDRTNAERQRRYIARLKAQAAKAGVSNAAVDPDHAALVKELAQAKARIAELEKADASAAAEIATLKAELASERSARAAAEAKYSKPGSNVDDEAAAGGPITGKKVFKILLKLDDSNDNTVLVAARKLVSDLKANGTDLRTLADALGAEWEKQQKAKPAPPPPIDWSEVESAVTRYAADRATVNFNRMWKALKVEVPALDAHHGMEVPRYFVGCLRRLGFTGSSSSLTWHRT